jgi:hypothetical protein
MMAEIKQYHNTLLGIYIFLHKRPCKINLFKTDRIIMGTNKHIATEPEIATNSGMPGL